MLTHYSIIFNFNGIDIFIFLLKNYIKVEAFWPPLQSVFAKDTAFLSAKAQSSRIRLTPNSGTVRRSFMEESYIGFEKAGETSLLPPLRSLVIPTEPSGEWRNLVFAFGKQRKLRF